MKLKRICANCNHAASEHLHTDLCTVMTEDAELGYRMCRCSEYKKGRKRLVRRGRTQ